MTAPGPESARPLSPRELEIIERITNGMTNHEIAAELLLSTNSVKSHIRAAYRKIGVERRSQAIVWGARRGLLGSGPRAADEISR